MIQSAEDKLDGAGASGAGSHARHGPVLDPWFCSGAQWERRAAT